MLDHFSCPYTGPWKEGRAQIYGTPFMGYPGQILAHEWSVVSWAAWLLVSVTSDLCSGHRPVF